MKTKPFSKITVSEIIKSCGVNRKTFYYHFHDIYELLKWMLEEEAIEVVKHFDLPEDHEAAIAFVMDYVEKNDYIISCAYDSIGRDEMKRFFYRDFFDVVSAVISGAERQCNTCLDPEYKNFLCQFYSEAIAGILIDWAKNKETRNRSQIIEYISRTFKGMLIGILKQ